MAVARTKSIALSGVLLSLNIIVLFIATITPINELSLYALSSLPIVIITVEFGIRRAWLYYMTATILSLVLIPNKLAIIPFAVFFGNYAIIKYYIELKRNIYIEYALKVGYFSFLLVIASFFLKSLIVFENNLLRNSPIWIVFGVLIVVFVIYDYVFTLFIQYYNSKLRHLINSNKI